MEANEITWFTLPEATVGRDYAHRKHPRITLSVDSLRRLGDHVLRRIHGPTHPNCRLVIGEVVRELRFEERPAAAAAIAEMLSQRSVVAREEARRRERMEHLVDAFGQLLLF